MEDSAALEWKNLIRANNPDEVIINKSVPLVDFYEVFEKDEKRILYCGTLESYMKFKETGEV